jgi:ATP-binding cassette subfamily B protein
MDCGPAALKCILEGFGIPVSYGRLREACQTDVDGTSINTLEDIAIQLGLRAEQVMLPADHLVLSEAQALPAIVVVQLPSGLTHFLVVWGRIGGILQVMDPATGRRWPSWKRFLNEVYIHSFPVPAEAWREWAGSEGLLAPLRRRMQDLKLAEAEIADLEKQALNDPGWRALATLDAAVRMVASIVQAGGLQAGEQAGRVLKQFFSLNLSALQAPAGSAATGESAPAELHIPTHYWSVVPTYPAPDEVENDQAPTQLILRGAVLVRILGKQEGAEQIAEDLTGTAELSPDLQAALQEPAYRPEKHIWQALRQDGLLTPGILILAIFLATLSVTIEALLFQGMLQIGQAFSLVSQRILAVLVVFAFLLAPLLLEFPISSTLLRMGRRLEARLRIAYLEKVPRLGDRYFRSRLASDMTQRAHDLRQLRSLPNLGMGLLRTTFQLILTTLGVIWLDPISAPLAIMGAIFFAALSFLSRPLLEERDLRMRTHTGALSRFYLDALLGLVPVKTHGGERAMRRQHEMQLFEWMRTGREVYGNGSLLHTLSALLYSGFAILILFNYLINGGQAGEILLLFYWTLNLPALGQALADQVQQYPMQRNRVLRLLEPLGAPDEEEAWQMKVRTGAGDQAAVEADPGASPPKGVKVELNRILVQAGGHTILQELNLRIDPGEHLAIVGPSGAGKSTLLGLLLGWHRPSQGEIRLDGELFDGQRLKSLRRETAWVDPAIQLWNRTLYDNLRYGSESGEGFSVGSAIQKADLFTVLERLPDGMKSSLGESGGLLSGGEGQRVRLGRAMLHQGSRLALLDEPFRGLDRDKRRDLLMEARRHWQDVTLLCVTHDVGETLNFPRVLVIENGRIIEDGAPATLAQQPGTRYRNLLEAEAQVRQGLWEGAGWRKMIIDDGILQSELPDVEP